MEKIELKTLIKAPIDVCFDLSRSIDLHQLSVQQTKEKAVGGVTSGLIGLNQKVRWQATHLGFRQTLEIQITKYTRPFYFSDEMVKGIFKTLIHDHFFYDMNDETMMVDHFYFESPLGLLGELANFIFLKQYLTRLLTQRNEVIKEYAESDEWMQFIPHFAGTLQSVAENRTT
ncbi:MAG: SRPBCC family protein [Cyclobacteriaceae bacterium]|nr:SRPBCC family protein [Cyclobacteriaceae bacterium]